MASENSLNNGKHGSWSKNNYREGFNQDQDNALNKKIAQASFFQDSFECNETFLTRFLKRK